MEQSELITGTLVRKASSNGTGTLDRRYSSTVTCQSEFVTGTLVLQESRTGTGTLEQFYSSAGK